MPLKFRYIVQTPERYFFARNDAFWALTGPDLTHSATCGLGKEKKKEKRQFSSFAAVDGQKSHFPITLAIGLYNSLYDRTSRDNAVLLFLYVITLLLQVKFCTV